MAELTERQMEDVAREYEYLHGTQRSRKVGSVTVSSPVRQRKTMHKLTEKQKEQREEALKGELETQRFGIAFYPEEMHFKRGFDKGYTAAVNRECVWKLEGRNQWYAPMYKPACGASPSMWPANFCPNCGGKVKEGNG